MNHLDLLALALVQQFADDIAAAAGNAPARPAEHVVAHSRLWPPPGRPVRDRAGGAHRRRARRRRENEE